MDNIFAVIKQYEQNGKEFKEWCYHWTNRDGIYSQMMIITDNDVEVSQDAENWVIGASVGDIFEFREGEIEIMEID